MQEDRLRAIAAGVNAHIAKPIDVDELIATLTRLATPTAPAATTAAVAGLAAAPAVAPTPVPGIDLDAGLGRMGGNYAAFVRLLKRFERSQGGTVAEVNELLAHEKRHGASLALHRLRGVAANLGANDIADLCAEAQAALADEQDSALSCLLQTLDDAIGTVVASARSLPDPDAAAPTLPGAGGGMPELHTGLAELLSLLRNSNMKALASYRLLRGAIAHECPELAPALAEAIDMLDFTAAEHLVKELLKRREWA
jgi:HPt (histidine-containing phosphotransfer) domain-containing protein